MTRHIFSSSALALALSLAAISPILPQSVLPVMSAGIADNDDRPKDVTVLAMTPDGTWGTATDMYVNSAIALAIEHCKRKYEGAIGCGYRFTTVRAGWSLGWRCGDRNILVADEDLATAQRAALREEQELRAQYAPDLPACEQVVTVDPDGLVVQPAVAYSRREPARAARE